MANLSAARLQIFEPPFTHTGGDYFGPFLTKRGRSHVMRYEYLFTCLTTRGGHSEMGADLTTDSFLNALRRFVARRKGVTHLYSDNGSNFVGAERVLKEGSKICDQKQMKEEAGLIGVNWSFDPPCTSHFGEAWER